MEEESGGHSKQRKLLEVKKKTPSMVCARSVGETKALLAFIRKLGRVR